MVSKERILEVIIEIQNAEDDLKMRSSNDFELMLAKNLKIARKILEREYRKL